MNAGIADVMNLSWMLAGVIKGWADEALRSDRPNHALRRT